MRLVSVSELTYAGGKEKGVFEILENHRNDECAGKQEKGHEEDVGHRGRARRVLRRGC